MILILRECDYITFKYLLWQVCLSSVTFVHPTQPVEIFGNVFTPFCTLVILDHYATYYGNYPRGTSPSRVKHKRGIQI